MNSPENYTKCDLCGTPEAKSRCGSCKCNYYCGRQCQVADWKNHKHMCKGLIAQSKHCELDDARALAFAARNEAAIGESCAICYDIIEKREVVQTPCRHIFCLNCMQRHSSNALESLQQLSCPLCRAEMDQLIILPQYIYSNACELLRKANRYTFISNEMKLHYCSLARAELEKLPPALLANGTAVRRTNVELLNAEMRFQEAVEVADELINQFKESSKSASEALSALIELLLEKIQCLNAQEKFQEAYSCIQELFATIPSDENAREKYKKETRSLFSETAKCYYGAKKYEQAIEAAEICIEMNRHYDECYKYLVLSYEALGDYDNAAHAIRRAIRYETPWNQKNTEKLQQSLQDLLSRQQQQQQQQRQQQQQQQLDSLIVGQEPEVKHEENEP